MAYLIKHVCNLTQIARSAVHLSIFLPVWNILDLQKDKVT